LLGSQLELVQAGLIDPFYGKENDKVVTIACSAALSKIVVVIRREQFAKYLISITSVSELNTAFDLVDYINQPWLISSLGVMLSNKSEIQSLGDTPPGFPNVQRVCDKTVPGIDRLSGILFNFKPTYMLIITSNKLMK
jgi:hypothetical protein